MDGQLKRASVTKEWAIGVLRGDKVRANTADLARKQGVSEETLCNWKVK